MREPAGQQRGIRTPANRLGDRGTQRRLELRVRFRGSRVRLLIRPDGVEARAEPPVQALTAAGQRVELTTAAQIIEPNPTRRRSYP
jgi:hypothetical protein